MLCNTKSYIVEVLQTPPPLSEKKKNAAAPAPPAEFQAVSLRQVSTHVTLSDDTQRQVDTEVMSCPNAFVKKEWEISEFEPMPVRPYVDVVDPCPRCRGSIHKSTSGKPWEQCMRQRRQCLRRNEDHPLPPIRRVPIDEVSGIMLSLCFYFRGSSWSGGCGPRRLCVGFHQFFEIDLFFVVATVSPTDGVTTTSLIPTMRLPIPKKRVHIADIGGPWD